MRHLILAGLGHTHALLLRHLARTPLTGVAVTCVTPFPESMYSGMLPGVLAGQYPRSAMNIDAAALCASAGAAVRVGAVEHIDHAGRQMHLDDGSALAFDVLSLNLGSAAGSPPIGAASPRIVAVRPLQTFLDRLIAAWAPVADAASSTPVVLTVVGGGLAGIELACTLPAFLRRRSPTPDVKLDVTLVTRGSSLNEGLAERTGAHLLAALARRGVRVMLNTEVSQAEGLGSDLVIWAAGASAPPVLARLGLVLDARGFIAVDATLRTSAAAPVFAAGDAAGFRRPDGTLLPRAGVYAVRQAPVLWHNLRAAVEDGPMRPYVPQSSFLRLVNTGDGRAIGEWRGWSFEGAWAWRLKDAIDRRFMRQFPGRVPEHQEATPLHQPRK